MYIIPLQSDQFRYTPEGHLGVFKFDEAKQTWQNSSEGLSPEGHYGGILRDAMTVDTNDEPGIYFGTTSGEVFARVGENPWQRLPGTLPRVLSVRVLES
jgi:hypothetical protein